MCEGNVVDGDIPDQYFLVRRRNPLAIGVLTCGIDKPENEVWLNNPIQ